MNQISQKLTRKDNFKGIKKSTFYRVHFLADDVSRKNKE